MSDTIGFVVRDAKTRAQVSIRFTLRSQARTFVEQCAMDVRIWRVVTRRRFSDGSLVPKTAPTPSEKGPSDDNEEPDHA